MCLAQGYNTVPLVRLESVTPQSQVKHSITELSVPLLLFSISPRMYTKGQDVFGLKCIIAELATCKILIFLQISSWAKWVDSYLAANPEDKSQVSVIEM